MWIQHKKQEIKKENEEMCDVREIIQKEYISELHIKNIERAIEEKNLIIGFRNTGEEVIKRINSYPQIAKKPHTILDKSLKKEDFEGLDDSLKNKYVALIPYRKGNFIKGKPIGLYLSQYGKEELKKKLNDNRIILKNNENKATFVTVSDYNIIDEKEAFKKLLSILDEIIELPKDKPNYYLKFFMTGDYDIHDIIANRAIVPSSNLEDENESEEKRILNILSTCCNNQKYMVNFNKNSNTWMKLFKPKEYCPIQHGSQYNYIAYMMNYEKENKVMLKVARYDKDVAFYDGKKWTIIKENSLEKQSESLAKFYKKNTGKELKWTWSDVNAAEEFLERVKRPIIK